MAAGPAQHNWQSAAMRAVPRDPRLDSCVVLCKRSGRQKRAPAQPPPPPPPPWAGRGSKQAATARNNGLRSLSRRTIFQVQRLGVRVLDCCDHARNPQIQMTDVWVARSGGSRSGGLWLPKPATARARQEFPQQCECGGETAGSAPHPSAANTHHAPIPRAIARLKKETSTAGKLARMLA